MLARVNTFAIDGIDPVAVCAEVDIRNGLPAFSIVGLADAAVREARERVRGALLNSGLEFPQKRITANLAPADLRKVGPGFDLAIACGVLAASGQVPLRALEGLVLFAELSLSGGLRGCPGVLAVADGTRRSGLTGLVVAHDRADEAALVDGITVNGAQSLVQVVSLLRGGPGRPVHEDGSQHDGSRGPRARWRQAPRDSVAPDLSDVRGHAAAIDALTIAAAGGHNILLSGPPGTGKTMLACCVPSILPPMTREEALEVTRIHSVAGIGGPPGLMCDRPFRRPHHLISPSGLVGGGAAPTPGEACLAHRGVLFLDELSEFSRSSLEALRQPLEDGQVAVVRGQRTAVYPTRAMVVASTNPCPCGHAGDDRRCRCTDADLARHRRKLSGPLLDRMDLLVHVQRPSAAELAAGPVTDSASAQARVVAARERQTARLAGTGVSCNADMGPRLSRRTAALDDDATDALSTAYRRGRLSARGHQRVTRVARTIADLAGCDRVTRAHVLSALSLRQDVEPDARLAA